MHSDLYSDDLDSMTNNLRDSANGSLVTYDEILHNTFVKEAENFRVRELVQKIENHPHREALHADLQQNNVYNPFSKNSKAMIRKLGNVELFELCETRPKVHMFSLSSLESRNCVLHFQKRANPEER